MQPHDTFTGSYQPGDVEFLLKPVVIEMTPVEQKEELIQSGRNIIRTCSVRSQRQHNGILICFTGRWIGRRETCKRSHTARYCSGQTLW